MTLIARRALRDFWSRRSTLLVLLALEALGVSALLVGGLMIHAVVVRPLPFPHADAVVQMWNEQPDRGVTHLYLSRAETELFREQLTTLESLVAFTTREVVVTADGASHSSRAVVLAGDLCELLGVPPVAGRCLSYADTAADAPPVAVMRAGAAVTRYGDPGRALGAEIDVDGQFYRVVGVVPDRLYLRNYLSHFFGPVDYMLPLSSRRSDNMAQPLSLMGRLVAPATFEAASAQIATLSRAYAAQLSDRNEGRVARLVTLHEETVQYARPQATAIAVGGALLAMLVLFNGFVVRKAEGGRRRVLILLKTALGASSKRLLAEEAGTSLITLAATGALAWNLSTWLITQFVQSEPWGVSGLQNEEAAVFYFVIALLVVSGGGIGISLAVVRHFLRSGDSFSASPSRTVGSTRAEARGSRTMMLAQCAITAILLGCTLLLTKTMWNLANVDLGVRAENLFSVATVIPRALAETPERRLSMITRLLHGDAVADVEGIAIMNHPPLSMRATLRPVEVGGRPVTDNPPIAAYRVVSSNYFEVAGLPIVAGRTFAGPQRSRAAEYVVNQAFLRRVMNGQDPIAVPMRIPQEGGIWADGLPSEGVIVGVVGDVKHWGPDRQVPVEIYVSYEIDPPARFAVIFRSRGDDVSAATAVQQRLQAIAPELAAFPVRPIQADVDVSLRTHWFGLGLFGLFAVAAILVTALGLYGVASGYVTSHHGEIAVRMSIGATRRDVVALVAEQALIPAGVGAIVGGVALVGAGRMLESWLYEVRASDPALLALVPTSIILIAFVAVLGPLRAALRVQAIELLRGR